MTLWGMFDSKWSVDYEFMGGLPESNPNPICYVAENVDTGEVIRHWIDGSEHLPEYPTHGKALFIAFYASAEMSCHIALGFPKPLSIVDLFAEYRVTTNGRVTGGNGLIKACENYGIKTMSKDYKEQMRDRIMQGPPYTEEEKEEILNYCQGDVTATTKLFHAMKSSGSLNDLPNCLMRGRYMWALAQMEHNGIPMDMEKYTIVKDQWEGIKGKLIDKTDLNYGVYDKGVFKNDKFREYIEKRGIPWKLTPSGLPQLDAEYLKDQCKTFPELRELYELRVSLGQLRLSKLGVGNDGRNRCMLSAFNTLTGRNSPSSTGFLFGPATWIRNFIKPQEGYAIAYIDFEQQEIGIAAALSDDDQLLKSYESGDPYVEIAKTTGAIPEDGTKASHGEIRDRYKVALLSMGYGAEPQTIAARSGMTLAEAKLFHKTHKMTYRKYWEWITRFIDLGLTEGVVYTKFGWKYQTAGILGVGGGKPKSTRTLLNWPMQSYGSEMLRQSIIVLLENGIKVCAPVHDAVMIEAPIDKIDQAVIDAQYIMETVSQRVCGARIRTEAVIVRYPDNYKDKRGQAMWNTIWGIIDGEE